jgi:hypothetical protein
MLDQVHGHRVRTGCRRGKKQEKQEQDEGKEGEVASLAQMHGETEHWGRELRNLDFA